MTLQQQVLRIVLVLVPGMYACGPQTSVKGTQPSWRQQQPQTQSQIAEAQAEFIELGPTTTTVSQYNTAKPGSVPSSDVSDTIVQVISEISSALGQSPPESDARLYRALNELATVASRETLPYPLIEFALQRNGIIEPSPHLLRIVGDATDPEQLAEQLREGLSKMLQTGQFTRMGIGTAKRPDGDLVIVAFQQSHLQTRPIPRSVPKNGSISISGTLEETFSQPHFFHTDETGKVGHLKIRQNNPREFSAQFSCKGHRGRQQLEITAEDSSGSTVLANFPVWCGATAPVSMRIKNTAAQDQPNTVAEAEELMLQLVNRDRAKQGVPALRKDDQLTRISRLHSEEMVQTGQVGHVSQTTGSAADRVRKGGVRTAVVLENIARAQTIEEAHEGLMNSPGHRENLLSREVNRLGIGVVFGENVAAQREVYVTQTFTLVPDKIHPTRVRERAVGKIQSAKPTLRNHTELARIAQQIANDLARGIDSNEASRRANATLDTAANNFQRVTTQITAVANINNFDPAGALGGPQEIAFGAGVAQGSHPVIGEGAIYVVVLLGRMRD